VEGNGNFTQLPIVSSSHEKYVKAFAQTYFLENFEVSGPEMQAKF
jgi:hypothetical protein